ncbi:ACP phosphodiesterase [Arsenophonus sp. aPb]|uniref:acyl carrier protein phosphodiesterase n=1 Tax=Arsenophonus sp. aPb TaxID=3041619 RepID=UPI0024692B66|nr:ACP phosphodiesterase [Arsenophonus sp. aPb]WGL97789.1 ACP phosphodiesterase [Arsenophonus sp. aPb]
MNFLAHLHLAQRAQSSLLGNLMADFVRGNPDGLYSPDVVAGIRMHRQVDKFTDQHPIVINAKQLFRPPYRRVAAITLDLVWDHFLALYWDQIESKQTLSQFVHYARQQIEPNLYYTPEKFQELNEYLWSQNWLIRYAEPEYISDVLNSMARRRPKLVDLIGSFDDFILHYSHFSTFFWQFYPEMITFAETRTAKTTLLMKTNKP